MGSGSGAKVVSECFVEPHHGLQKPTPPFHLTPWDANLLNFHFHIQIGLLFAVKPPEMKTLLENLKSSLSLTLLHFYPIAGRIRAIKHINGNNNETLILNHENEKEAVNNANAGVSYSYHVDCNNSPDVKFIHAISLHKDFSVPDLLHSQSPTDDDDVPAGVLQSLFMDDREVIDLESKSLLTITVVGQPGNSTRLWPTTMTPKSANGFVTGSSLRGFLCPISRCNFAVWLSAILPNSAPLIMNLEYWGNLWAFTSGNRNRMSDGSVCACSGREHGSIALDICLSPDAMSRLLSHKHFMESVL
ncbi:hypothetical protein FEM48_Zijuj10G0003100 [Ziziphus jujuba var. spinosa]|uniref:Uncharacterized protein n=1 Tax=Ziziphus jujuba var. spinosa TaxID=714518 RepID=A0A978UK60_ZIZJJ|nr:hypothetical protein FEM48_Zijuj10G0003100 [Ziziphus jujuba var. spinosa]